jgi:hypothetical protein
VGIRVIIVVEDSAALHQSCLLPILYRELVVQTQEVIRQGLNQEHRLLTMRLPAPRSSWPAPSRTAWTCSGNSSRMYWASSPTSDTPGPGGLDPSAGVDLLSRHQGPALRHPSHCS